ncbi:MAG TPA: hypothetical protein ENI31_03135 [Candidatus Omnitrophica bacterium]|nr:MAG: hypothetical protein DRP61_04010 [Candidatus Omnitrophota bacterium]RKY35248.1 MAG: hypothetical protein DRP69_02175 [Candidatus Omnitrophota bacterium]RKY43885.1 MAG: hypothetical protein DRP80_03975 [Candidatus Omnitrophota bacterium]HEC69264.1 hypothetical protein [Candidatus Omnitrophota bacterium]
MLIKLRKAQSTAEYALVFTAVIAFLAVGQVLLKGALKKKAQQALGYYDDQTTGGDIDLSSYGTEALPEYEQQHYDTVVSAQDYLNERVVKKGGAEEKIYKTKQKREGTTIEVDTLEE